VNPNEFKNNLTPAYPFPSNGTEGACFKSCVDTKDCAYALYSNSGCGIDCNPNKCLLFTSNADGVAPVKELPSALSTACPVSGDSAGTDAWCKTFNRPVSNSIIPALVLRLGGTDWRGLAMQMPNSTVNAADSPMTVDLTTNVQTWGPDSQFSDVNYSAGNEISLQFRFFAEYWLNAYGLQSGSAPVVAGQGMLGTFAFSKLSSTNASASSYNVVATSGMWSGEGPNEYTCNDEIVRNNDLTRNTTGGYGDFGRYCIFNKESDAQKYCSSDPRCKGYVSNQANTMFTITANPVPNPQANGRFHEIVSPKEGSTSYVGTFAGQTMFWNSAAPSTGGTAAGLKTAAALAATTSESSKFNYNYSAFEKPVWNVARNENAMIGSGQSNQLPPQLAGMSIPSWQFLGLHDSAEACQRAATDDPAHVYTAVTYYNASYNNPKNGNSVFARMCYGNVAGAPSVTGASAQDDNVQTMTPAHGFTKLGGKEGINHLRNMYRLNQQIMALTDELKISSDQTAKEAFTQRGNDPALSDILQRFKTDEANLIAAIQSTRQMDVDASNAEQLLLQSRIKFGVAVVIGLILAFFAFQFLMADELPATIETALGSSTDTYSSYGLNDGN